MQRHARKRVYDCSKGIDGRRASLDHPLELRTQERVVDRVAVADVLVERGARHPCPLGDGRDQPRARTALTQDLRSGVQDPAPQVVATHGASIPVPHRPGASVATHGPTVYISRGL